MNVLLLWSTELSLELCELIYHVLREESFQSHWCMVFAINKTHAQRPVKPISSLRTVILE